MRVSRRSNLSRLTADDDWLTDPWWESPRDGGKGDGVERELLEGPTIAQDAPRTAPRSATGPLIDPRLAASDTARARRRQRKR